MAKTVFLAICLLSVCSSAQEVPLSIQNELDDYRASLQTAAYEVLEQYAESLDEDDRLQPFQAPANFMHSFRANTGIGNREELIIDDVVQVPMFDDESFTRWQYFRFSNMDYILALNDVKMVLWKKHLNLSESIVFSIHESFFIYDVGVGYISDAVMFVKTITNRDELYIAVLIENGSSFINIYEVLQDEASMAVVITLPYKTYLDEYKPAKNLGFLESRHQKFLLVLVSNVNQIKLLYRQKDENSLSNYMEVHFPTAIDLVTFTVGDRGYFAVANETVCFIYETDEFGQNPGIFDRLYFVGGIVDLEQFRFGVSTYLLVSTADYQVLYVWKEGGFFTYQEFFEKDVKQGYSIFLPFCGHDVILLFIKNTAQPAFYIWNTKQVKFANADLGDKARFMPSPGSITSFSLSRESFILFINRKGYSELVRVRTHSNPLPNPTVEAAKEVSDLMMQIQNTLNEQEKTLQSMHEMLQNAVRPDGGKIFTEMQIFSNLEAMNSVSASAMTNMNVVWEGSSLTQEEYQAGTDKLEASISELEKELDRIENILSDAVLRDEDALITGTKYFEGDVSGTTLIAESLNVKTVGDINLQELQKDIYRLDRPKVVDGMLVFEKPLTILNDLNATTINGISMKDVMTTDGQQVSNADMSFGNELVVRGNLDVSGLVNGISIKDEVITLGGNHVITGYKNFEDGIVATNLVANFIDNVDVNRLLTTTLTKSGKQTITGTKQFKGLYTHDVNFDGKINGLNFNELIDDIVCVDVPSVITGHKTFMDDVYIQGSLFVNGTVDNLHIPDDLFLVDVPNVVTGHKTFTNIVEANNVTVLGTVNGLSLPSDVVTLDQDEYIDHTLYFADGITVDGDITVGLVDGLDLSEVEKTVLKREDVSSIPNAIFKGPITILGDLTVLGVINGVSLPDLVNDIVYKDETDVLIQSSKIFTQLTADSIKINGRINGYNIPEDFMTTTGDQTIYGTKIFTQPVTFQDVTTATDIISGVNITRLYKSRISLIVDEEHSGDLEFADNLIIDGNITIHGTIGGLRFPQDFVLKSANQVISNKVFSGKVRAKEVKVSNNVLVDETFGNLKLPEFVNERVTLSTDQDIVGDVMFGTISAEKVTIDETINGLNIQEFADNVMSLTKDQVVTGYKEFTGETTVFGPITTEQGIDGIKLDEVNQRAFKLKGGNKLSGTFTFIDPVIFENIEITGLINNINLTEFDQDSLKKDGVQVVSGTTIFHNGFHVDGDIITPSVNDLYIPEDVLTINTNQTIFGTFTLHNTHVKGNLEVTGSVNGIKLSEEAPLLAGVDGENIIQSDVIFKLPVRISGDVDVSGFVNDVDLHFLENSTLKKSGDQHVLGHKILRGNVTVHGDVMANFINGIHWQKFMDNLVYVDTPQQITGPKHFVTDVSVEGDVYVNGIAEIETINDINLKKLGEDIVYINQPANITGHKVFLNPVEIVGDLNAELINDLDLKNDIVTLQCGDTPQVITGQKTFRNLTVYGNIWVSGNINGYNFRQLVTNTLTVTGNQVISGHKQFQKPVEFLKNVHASTVNNLVLHNDLVTLDTPQVITGVILFRNNVYLNKDLELSGLLNGVDLQKLAKDVLYSNKEQIVEGTYTIEHAVAEAPVIVEGTVNGMSLKDFYQNVSNFINERNYDLKILEHDLDDQCQIVKHLYYLLSNSYYTLDGFEHHQLIDKSAEEIIVSKSGDIKFLTAKPDGQLLDLSWYKWNLHKSRFELYSEQESSIFNEKSFDFSGHVLTLQNDLKSKTSSILLDGHFLKEASLYTDSDVLVLGNIAVISLLFGKRNICSIYEIVADDTITVDFLHDIEIEGATSVEMFEISSQQYIAFSCDLSPHYSKGSSKIYSWMNEKWQMVQNILAPASSHVKHFTYQGYHYLAFANAVPVYETKELQAVQIYRHSPYGKKPFALFQKVLFDNGKAMEIFEFGSLPELYLTVWNETRVQVFHLVGESGFQLSHTLPGDCITTVRPIVSNTSIYVFVGQNNKELNRIQNTIVYRGLTKGFTAPSMKLQACL